MKVVAQFQGHEVSADGVLVEVTRAFGDASELLAIFDEDQLRELLALFGTAPHNVRDCNRLELLYLLSSKVRDSNDALRVSAYVTEKFGAQEDDDALLPLCEALIEYSSFLDDEDEEEEDDDDLEQDETNCDCCGDEFDNVGRCSCATSYDYDEDEEHNVIKPKADSEVLNIKYANAVNELRDDVVLSIIPYIYSAEGADIHLHTAEHVRLWLQQATHRDLLNTLNYIQNPDESLRGPDVIQQNPNLFNERHMALLQILSELHPQDPPHQDDEDDREADDENFALPS